jgi:glycogen synthase
MKLLMTADTIGGVWTYSIELLRRLQAHGVQIVLATMGRMPNPGQCAQIRELSNVELIASEYRLEWMENPWRDVEAAGEWLLELDGRIKPDVVHLNGYAHAALPWTCPVLVVAHSCVLSWWLAVHGEQAPEREWSTYLERVGRGLRAADHLAAPTAAMLRSIQELYHCAHVPSDVIPNGRDARLFRPALKHRFIFSAGRVWDPAKNIKALSEVAPGLHWPVYVAGESSIQSVASQAAPGGAKNLHFVGALGESQMARWLAQSAVYCGVPRYEPFGLSILEAALSGCALVLSEITSLRETWGSSAFFVPLDDAAALRSALDKVASDEHLRRELAGRAQDRAKTLTPETMALSYLELYRSLISRERQRREARTGVAQCAS